MKNDAKSFIFELTPLHAQNIWRFRRKRVRTMKLAEKGRIPLFPYYYKLLLKLRQELSPVQKVYH